LYPGDRVTAGIDRLGKIAFTVGKIREECCRMKRKRSSEDEAFR
jgi:hypothetical protein